MSHWPSATHTIGPRRSPLAATAAAGLVVIVFSLTLLLTACSADPDDVDLVGTTAATTAAATRPVGSDDAGLADIAEFEEPPPLPQKPPAGIIEFSWQESVMPLPDRSEGFVELITETAAGYLALGYGYMDGPGVRILAWESSDGLNWRRNDDVTGVPRDFEPHRIVAAAQGYVAVGGVSQDEPPWGWRPVLLRSEDGVRWDDVSPVFSLLEGERVFFNEIASGASGVVVTGSIDFEPDEPPLVIHKDGLTLTIDHNNGTLEVRDETGTVVYSGSSDELYNDAETDEGMAVFHPETGERLFVVPWDQVEQIDRVLSAIDHGHDVAASAPFGSVRDQGQIYSTDGLVEVATATWSQSITAGLGGQLAAIQLFVESPLPADLHLAVFEGANPATGSALFSQQVTATDNLLTWDVRSANLIFEEGEMFTVAFSAPEAGVVVAANDGPGYDGGELFKDGVLLPESEPNDVAFVSYVVDPGAEQGEPTAEQSITIEVEGYSLVLTGLEPGDPEGGSFEIRDLASDSLVASGGLPELTQGPPPRFVTSDGTVVMAFDSWEEYWEAENAHYDRLDKAFHEQFYSKPLALHSTDGRTWSPIDLTKGIASNQSAYVATASSGPKGFVLRGSVENDDTHQSLEVVWTSADGVDWDLATVPRNEDRYVWGVTATASGFLGLSLGGEGTAGVFHSVDGLSWEPRLVVGTEPDTYAFLGSIATGQAGTVVTAFTEGHSGEEGHHGHGDVIADDGDFDSVTTTIASAPPTTESPAHHPDEGDVGFVEHEPETTLYFSPDGLTYWEVAGDDLLRGLSISTVVVGGDRVFVIGQRFGGGDEHGDHRDGDSFPPLVLLVGTPIP